MTQGFLQWKRGYTRAWRWISCSQGHRERCHGMSPSLQQAHHHPPEGISFRHHNSTSYASTSDYDDNETEEFYDQYRMSLIRHWRKFCVQGDWNAKVGKDAYKNWKGICGPFCNHDANKRGIRLLEFATFDDLVLANTFGHHKASRR